MFYAGEDKVCYRCSNTLDISIAHEILELMDENHNKADILLDWLKATDDKYEEGEHFHIFRSKCINAGFFSDDRCITFYLGYQYLSKEIIKQAEEERKIYAHIYSQLPIGNLHAYRHHDVNILNEPGKSSHSYLENEFSKLKRAIFSKDIGRIIDTARNLNWDILAQNILNLPTGYRVGGCVVLWRMYFELYNNEKIFSSTYRAIGSVIWYLADRISYLDIFTTQTEDGQIICYSQSLHGYALAYDALAYLFSTGEITYIESDIIEHIFTNTVMQLKGINEQRNTFTKDDIKNNSVRAMYEEHGGGTKLIHGKIRKPFTVKLKDKTLTIHDPREKPIRAFLKTLCSYKSNEKECSRMYSR